MAANNLSMKDLDAADFGRIEVQSVTSVSQVNPWEAKLVLSIARAFGTVGIEMCMARMC